MSVRNFGELFSIRTVTVRPLAFFGTAWPLVLLCFGGLGSRTFGFAFGGGLGLPHLSGSVFLTAGGSGISMRCEREMHELRDRPICFAMEPNE
jgi:hypothetical protein